MDNMEKYIFSRCYQSYLTGGDIYSFSYKNEDTNKIPEYKKAIKSLEDKGYITIIYDSEKKTRMALTNEGIDHGNSVFSLLN